jgi:hypothetical protein
MFFDAKCGLELHEGEGSADKCLEGKGLIELPRAAEARIAQQTI